MNTKLILGAVAAAVAVFSQGAFAQASSPTRAEVKAEAKTGALAPSGQAVQDPTPSTKTSDTTRAARKAQAKQDNATGKIPASGQAVLDPSPSTKTSDTTRAARKATTKADAKAGQLQPSGENPNPVNTPMKK